MLRIRNAQMTDFSEHLRKRFVRRMVTHLRLDFAEELEAHGLASTDLDDFVQQGITRAAKYRVENECDLRLFIECRVMLSPGFDEDPKFPWARDVLSSPDLSGTEKMDRIHDYLLFGRDEA